MSKQACNKRATLHNIIGVENTLRDVVVNVVSVDG